MRLARAFSSLVSAVHLSSEEIERIARLSMLRLDRSSPEFPGVKRDLESVLGLLQRLKEADAAEPAGSRELTGPRSLSDGDRAESRLAELRTDVVAATPADAVLRHAPPGRREGSFFKVSEDS